MEAEVVTSERNTAGICLLKLLTAAVHQDLGNYYVKRSSNCKTIFKTIHGDHAYQSVEGNARGPRTKICCFPKLSFNSLQLNVMGTSLLTCAVILTLGLKIG